MKKATAEPLTVIAICMLITFLSITSETIAQDDKYALLLTPDGSGNYTVEDLSELSGSDWCRVTDINNNGQVVGYYQNQEGYLRGFM